ncbi:uncharacterized protein Z520_09209 [Fonsecaea multimorphosa CBS 102226]|uniref:Uncharacterized protein n=1 Tax=Fonsecaea multimorphosa CBS 102226 TaxID=1442371 RepID=A0A0D2GZF7_9EURO|nr:uncharacterized protein Z520_09209 [Fonsecaea multimorphosa CBS 102226]KIX94900.1 hypothetical protein Z520_09209 [Fonsecaea multimorphosa CBS 102226]OAL20791.1 hypothetical protein AYO22_08561 [Fonsecaea multimorphosa]
MEVWRYHPDGWHEPLLFTRGRGRRCDEAIYLGHGIGATFHVPPYSRRCGRRRPPPPPPPPVPWDYDDDSDYWSDDSDYRYRRGININNRNRNRNSATAMARALASNRVVVNNIYRPSRRIF